jgi:hypothetical protein
VPSDTRPLDSVEVPGKKRGKKQKQRERMSAGLAGASAALGHKLLLAHLGAQIAFEGTYPKTERGDVVDDYHGIKVADPFRWLETAGTKRDTATYRADTQKVLQSRLAQIETCYAPALAGDASAKGTVTVTFTVAKKTGVIEAVAIDRARSTAVEPVGKCVTDAMVGLKLDPPDANEGRATFTFELDPRPA